MVFALYYWVVESRKVDFLARRGRAACSDWLQMVSELCYQVDDYLKVNFVVPRVIDQLY